MLSQDMDTHWIGTVSTGNLSEADQAAIRKARVVDYYLYICICICIYPVSVLLLGIYS